MDITWAQREAITTAAASAVASLSFDAQRTASSLRSGARWLLIDASQLKSAGPGLSTPERAASVIVEVESVIERAARLSSASSAYARLLLNLNEAPPGPGGTFVIVDDHDAATALCALGSVGSDDTDLGMGLAARAKCADVCRVDNEGVSHLAQWLARTDAELVTRLIRQSPYLSVLDVIRAAAALH